MPARSSRASARRVPRHGRHGRVGRSVVFGPELTHVGHRADAFEDAVLGAIESLRQAWSAELAGVRFEVAGIPTENVGGDGVDRWRVDHAGRRIVLYRLPIERLGHLQRREPEHRRVLIESVVFRAAAEYVGRDPWDIAPGHFD